MTEGAGVVQQLFTSMASGDMETVASLLADDFVFELGGSSRFAGRHVGRDRFFALQGDLAAATEIQNEIVAIHPIEGGAIVHQRGRGRDGYSDEALLLMSVAAGRLTAVKEFLFDHGPLESLAG